MKNLTPWNNSNGKAPVAWSNTPKNQSQWVVRNGKNLTSYTAMSKNLDAWAVKAASSQAYQYDSADMTYDSPLWFYNGLVNNNQTNQLGVTKWVQT